MWFGYHENSRRVSISTESATYKQEQLELNIPSKFRDAVEPFLDKEIQILDQQLKARHKQLPLTRPAT